MAFFKAFNMKKKFRLKKNEEIAKVIAKRKCIKNQSFLLFFDYNPDIENSRICISTSKKLGHAIVRNKIRRQVREMVADIFNYTLPYDYVIVVRNDYLTKTFKENKELLCNSYDMIKR